jgi:hypothetical protein
MFNNQTFFVAEQIEATVKTLLDSKDAKMSGVREELRKLEAEVRNKLKPQDFFKGDWFLATKEERDQATELHNYLFKKIDGDYLARFAALGLAHEGFNDLLKTPTAQAPIVAKDRSIEGTLVRIFNRVLEIANGKLTHTKPGQPADEKLASLVGKLVQIENRNKNILKSPLMGILNFADKKAIAARKGAKDTLSNILNTGMFKKNKNITVAAASSAVDIIASGQVKELVANIMTVRNKAYPERLGVIAGAFSEINGNTKALQKVLREGKAHLEGARKDIISMTKKNSLESFAEAGTYLSDKQKSSITSVLLRTGAYALLKPFGIKGLTALVTDTAFLGSKIKEYEDSLLGLGNHIDERIILDSKALGYALITNKSMIADRKMNAHNIAHQLMTVYHGQLTEAKIEELIPVIDELVSLYALSYSASLDRAALSEVLTKENARTDGGNGVERALLAQQHFAEESLSRLFYDNPILMVKGYTPEIYNPHTDLQTANAKDGEKLLNLGYKLVSPLKLDPNDPFREPQFLYVLRGGGMLPWLSGMFSMTDMRSKGTQHHSDKAKGTQAVLARNAGNGRVVAGEGRNFDPRKATTEYMTPTLNESGTAANYRYMMHTSTKDNLLERENRFDEVLGALAGSVFDKEKSSEHNKKAVQVLYEDFKEGFTKRSTVFLEVSETSSDPELREIWKMLPKKTKDSVREIWGKDAMMVRPENLIIAFGYRKFSLSNRFLLDITDQNILDKAMIGLVSTTMKTYGQTFKHMTPEEAKRFSLSHAVVVRRIESAVQEIMQMVKEMYTIKIPITSINNIKSNVITLLLYGTNPVVAFRDMRIAWVGAEEHRRDSTQLYKLQQQLAIGYVKGDTSEIESEIQRLTEALKNNPVSKMLEDGLMPTIVEDVATEEDSYTYQTAFAKRMEKYTDKLNPTVRKVARNIAMTKDTKGYQALNRIVQLSDFVARYALYQHLIKKEIEPMTPEAAADEVYSAFVGYDVPMHRTLEYTDSIGLTMFTKYFLRVQRVIRGRIKHAPGKLAMMLLAESFLGDLPTIVDSSMFIRAGNNPLQSGPFELLSAIPQLPSLFWLPGR